MCVFMVLCDGLAYHTGCILTSCPVFLEEAPVTPTNCLKNWLMFEFSKTYEKLFKTTLEKKEAALSLIKQTRSWIEMFESDVWTNLRTALKKVWASLRNALKKRKMSLLECLYWGKWTILKLCFIYIKIFIVLYCDIIIIIILFY